MKYQITYNSAHKVWAVWRVIGQNAEVVKTFKTEASAQRWIEKQGA